MNYAELKSRDPALANAVAELIGQYSPEYYRGFIRAVNIVMADQKGGVNRLEEYKAYCNFQVGEPKDAPIVDLMIPEKTEVKKIGRRVKREF